MPSPAPWPALRPAFWPARRLARLALAACLAAALSAWLAGCATPPQRPSAYGHPVAAGGLYHLGRAQPLEEARLMEELAAYGLVFLGEIHPEPSSHGFHGRLLEGLAKQGRKPLVGLEMFSPADDPALEDWRQGKMSEAELLEKTGWYRQWGYPFAPYRPLFAAIRAHRLETHGLNVTAAERRAFAHPEQPAQKSGKTERPAQAAVLPALLEPPDLALAPHRDYVLETLKATGHAGDLKAGSPDFEAYYRAQALWDEAMGQRAARLALGAAPGQVTVAVIGTGHLVYGLGAPMRARRLLARRHRYQPPLVVVDLPQETSPPTLLASGLADVARLVEDHPPLPTPALSGVAFNAPPKGLEVARSPRAGHPLAALRPGDRLLRLDGQPYPNEAAFKLAAEALPPGPHRLEINRQGKTMALDFAAQPPAAPAGH